MYSIGYFFDDLHPFSACFMCHKALFAEKERCFRRIAYRVSRDKRMVVVLVFLDKLPQLMDSVQE